MLPNTSGLSEQNNLDDRFGSRAQGYVGKELFLKECLKELQNLTSYEVSCWFPDYSITADGLVHQGEAWEDFLEGRFPHCHPIVHSIHVHEVENGKIVFDDGGRSDIQHEPPERLISLANLFSSLYQAKLNSYLYRDWLYKLDNLLNSMSDGIVLLNVRKNVIHQNEAFVKFIKAYNDGKTVINENQLFKMFVQINELESSDIEEFAAKDDAQIRIKVQAPGKIRYFEVKKFAVYENSEPFGNVYSIRDITKEYEIDQIKSNLISIASHEFKTPLTNIRGSVETLLRGISNQWDESFSNDLLLGIHEDVLHLQELIDVWMDVKKIETGTLLLHQDFFPLFKLIKGTLNQLPEKVMSQGEIVFNYDTNSKFPLLYGDEARLRQVLINLIMNGLTYNVAEKKKITIDIHHDDEFIIIEVNDNGIGISEKNQKKIFDRFYRVDISAARKSGGSGLGLSISQGLIREHGGDIYVQSRLKEGSTFTVKLPLIQAP
ncbi:sensor histidine kinase [Paenibacillus brevis]|uniref:histidine kinase n=1 Tax=Paenibacillus brevis TaxID=2841508 RepID=A0ABS6FVJ6_9BACL|nr:HAMP domain-containing sensor histidine kinase [Paenibacillus brevis]MBU5674258.1 HAMP domain-containing histidine kinase [Paenibacillus brevis]